ncbi:MAG: hypothetical protein R3E79_61845 [Caldilineaceae bacterium]
MRLRETAVAEGPTYYDRPVIKEPVWIWAHPVVLFYRRQRGATGGLRHNGATLWWPAPARAGKPLPVDQAIGAIISAVLLIGDLGRPALSQHVTHLSPDIPHERGVVDFDGVQRVDHTGGIVQPASWSAQGRGWRRRRQCLFGVGNCRLHRCAVEQRRRPAVAGHAPLLPVLFMATGMASAAALLDLLPAQPPRDHRCPILWAGGPGCRVVAAAVVEREAARVERVGRPLQEGLSGQLWKASKWIGGVGLLLSFLPGNPRSADRRGSVHYSRFPAIALWPDGCRKSIGP